MHLRDHSGIGRLRFSDRQISKMNCSQALRGPCSLAWLAGRFQPVQGTRAVELARALPSAASLPGASLLWHRATRVDVRVGRVEGCEGIGITTACRALL